MSETKRHRIEPTVDEDGTIHMYGVGPKCPGCGGPTHAVTGDENAERPWWCKDCNVRFDDGGNFGSAAQFPANSKPSRE